MSKQAARKFVSAPGSFGARPCRAIRRRLFALGVEALPRGWRRRWIIARIRATPEWADFSKIKKKYALARRLTEETGIPHEVDHEVPLQHVDVCGLHVDNNLIVRTQRQNSAKGNRWMPDQMELPLA